MPCHDCKHFSGTQGALGRCQAHPPQLTTPLMPSGPGSLSLPEDVGCWRQPEVEGDREPCGEYRRG